MINTDSGTKHCHNHAEKKIDYFFWLILAITTSFYLSNIYFDVASSWINVVSKSTYEFINTIWWGILLGVLMVGVLSKIPREFIISILGKGDSFGGIIRATLAGLLLDLCSHGILMVGIQLYKRGASIGQVMAFLISSPWNSFSLTLILIALVGIKWTVAFIVLSMTIAIISGLIFNYLVRKKKLPANPYETNLPEDFKFFSEAKKQFKSANFNHKFFLNVIIDGIKDSKMVIRWILLGVILAGILRASISMESFQTYFGVSLAGLGLTIIVATILEVCSEGSAPIAADLLTRAKAPGNSFAFLMTGVATDYTEIMSIKDATKSWKISLFLPLITVPQVVLVSYLINVGSM